MPSSHTLTTNRYWPSTASATAIAATALLANAAPTLLAHNVAPSSTFLNQALSIGLWGWFVMACAWWQPRGLLVWRDTAALSAGFALLAAAVLGSWLLGSLPSSLALSALGSLLVAWLVMLAGSASARGPLAALAFNAFCWAWVTAGVLGVVVAMVQVFAPGWADGDWIAHSGIAGRAVGNLRQPNHLSSVLLWAAVALVALQVLGRVPRRLAWALMALLVFAVVLTASRTGLVSVLLLALWGLLDGSLTRRARALLLATPLLYALAWLGMAAWGHWGQHNFGGAARLAETDISGSRFAIWANSLALIRAQPWLGVGFGEFNLAWSLTPFAQRPVAFFDHAHNLLLHLAVELGLPLTLILTALLAWGLWQVMRSTFRHDVTPEFTITQRCAFMMVLMIALHSQLEYPLWYAYFLLPTLWLWGFALGQAGAARAPRRGGVLGAPGFTVVAATLVAGAALTVLDYGRVTVIFSAAESAPPLQQRIAQGQRSLLFAHHADYAAATIDNPARPLAPFRGATHFLLDTRLMMAWAEALHAAGQEDAARHVAARLREFRNAASKEFFDACTSGVSTPVPFQCQAPGRVLSWSELAR
jgi:Virulence factor membrane-bound polymerase, C-terminal/O-Antigen ligase/Protein glycosylation ligase